MTQTDRIIKLAEADAEIGRLEIRVQEAQGRLDAANLRRREIAKGCTHKDGRGFAMGEAGMFGVQCKLCGEKDF